MSGLHPDQVDALIALGETIRDRSERFTPEQTELQQYAVSVLTWAASIGLMDVSAAALACAELADEVDRYRNALMPLRLTVDDFSTMELGDWYRMVSRDVRRLASELGWVK